MDINDYINKLASMSEKEVVICTGFVKPLVSRSETMTPMDGYQAALISLNLVHFYRLISLGMNMDGSYPTEMSESDIKFVEDFKVLLNEQLDILPTIINSFTQELEELKTSDPDMYEEFIEVINGDTK